MELTVWVLGSSIQVIEGFGERGCMYPFGSCFPLCICPGVGLQDYMVALFLVCFFKEPPYCSP